MRKMLEELQDILRDKTDRIKALQEYKKANALVAAISKRVAEKKTENDVLTKKRQQEQTQQEQMQQQQTQQQSSNG